jgi:hypothetical protein
MRVPDPEGRIPLACRARTSRSRSRGASRRARPARTGPCPHRPQRSDRSGSGGHRPTRGRHRHSRPGHSHDIPRDHLRGGARRRRHRCRSRRPRDGGDGGDAGTAGRRDGMRGGHKRQGEDGGSRGIEQPASAAPTTARRAAAKGSTPDWNRDDVHVTRRVGVGVACHLQGARRVQITRRVGVTRPYPAEMAAHGRNRHRPAPPYGRSPPPTRRSGKYQGSRAGDVHTRHTPPGHAAEPPPPQPAPAAAGGQPEQAEEPPAFHNHRAHPP